MTSLSYILFPERVRERERERGGDGGNDHHKMRVIFSFSLSLSIYLYINQSIYKDATLNSALYLFSYKVALPFGFIYQIV